MNAHLVTLLLLTTGDIHVAVRTPAGQVHVTTLPNTERGTHQFQSWASRAAKLQTKSPAHSCLASQSEGDSPLYGSPFLRLAYEFKGNTAIWAEPLWEAAAPGIAANERTAQSMFAHCAATVGHR